LEFSGVEKVKKHTWSMGWMQDSCQLVTVEAEDIVGIS
jgi:hypothetical protein